MNRFRTTKHSEARIRQRGLRASQVQRLVELADLDVSVGPNATAIRLSRKASAEAIADGLSPAVIEKLTGKAVVLADDGAIITVAHLYGRKSSSYTRRDRRAYWR